jgi:hypothetical protein
MLLRRACHCRNCGVCICKDCSVQWPAKMIPDTYNIKKEGMVNACKSCDWLSISFRLALLEGDHDRAVSLYSTGNVNLHTPFANVKGELFYPVHCAVLGGNLHLLQFLVDENCCPIRSIRVSGSVKDQSSKYIPVVTSKGRSLLGIAMEGENLSIVRYLVVEKGLSLSDEKDLTHDLLCRNFEKLLRVAPESLFLDMNDCMELDREIEGVSVSPVPNDTLNGLEPLSFVTSSNNNGSIPIQVESADVEISSGPLHTATRRRSSRGIVLETFPNSGSSVHEECMSVIVFSVLFDLVHSNNIFRNSFKVSYAVTMRSIVLLRPVDMLFVVWDVAQILMFVQSVTVREHS